MDEPIGGLIGWVLATLLGAGAVLRIYVDLIVKRNLESVKLRLEIAKLKRELYGLEPPALVSEDEQRETNAQLRREKLGAFAYVFLSGTSGLAFSSTEPDRVMRWTSHASDAGLVGIKCTSLFFLLLLPVLGLGFAPPGWLIWPFIVCLVSVFGLALGSVAVRQLYRLGLWIYGSTPPPMERRSADGDDAEPPRDPP